MVNLASYRKIHDMRQRKLKGVISTIATHAYIDFTPISHRGKQRLQRSTCYDADTSFVSTTRINAFKHALRLTVFLAFNSNFISSS